MTTSLILRLLSQQPLKSEERSYIASLLSGEQMPRQGRPSRNPAPHDQIAQVFAKARRSRPGIDGPTAVAPLAKLLQSEQAIGLGEQLILANLIAGLMNSTGPPGLTAKENADDRELIFEALSREAYLKAAWNPKKHPPAENAAAAAWAAAYKAKHISEGFRACPQLRRMMAETS
jgi:hypothetical protein